MNNMKRSEIQSMNKADKKVSKYLERALSVIGDNNNHNVSQIHEMIEVAKMIQQEENKDCVQHHTHSKHEGEGR